MFTRRLSILCHYVRHSERYSYMSWSDLLPDMVAPTSTMLARQYIEHVKITEQYLVCFLKGFDRPLYWPRSSAKRWLYQVVAEAFYKQGSHYYEVPETRVRAGDIVVDCGAAEGLFGLQIAGRAKRCYLIEPLPKFQQTLSLTFAGLSNVEILPVAIGAAPGTTRFNDDSIMSAVSETGTLAVTVETLDRLFYERGIPVDYLKMDLEGAEMSVLIGGEQTIRQYKPRIAITLYHAGQDANETVAYLRFLVPEYKYRLKGINGETGNPVMGHLWTERRCTQC